MFDRYRADSNYRPLGLAEWTKQWIQWFKKILWVKSASLFFQGVSEGIWRAMQPAGIGRTKAKPERAQARPVHHGCDGRAEADPGVVEGGAQAAGRDEVIGFRKQRASARRAI